MTISVLKSRAALEAVPVQIEPPVWDEVARELKSLVGMEGVREELLTIARTLQNIKAHRERHHLRHLPQLHCVIEGPPGGGKKRIAQLLAKLLNGCGLAAGPLYTLTLETMEGLAQAPAGSPLYIPLGPGLVPGRGHGPNPLLEIFWLQLKGLSEERTMILGVDTPGGEPLLEKLEFAQEIQLRISIPAYSWQHFLAYARKYAARSRFKLTESAAAELRRRLEEEQKQPRFLNMRTVEKLVDKAMMNYFMSPGEAPPQGRRFASLEAQHFRPAFQTRVTAEAKRAEDPLAELKGLVGLEEGKARVSQLLALVHLQQRRREQGLPTQPITTHMAFSGPPGTGKTTVARLVGQALKELGLLERGHLVEVAREDLVGQYVGHTAQKTAEVVERARGGGVLYIDECYSLNGGYATDFGKEAVATLVKKMEDERDSLTVIFSGYGREMEEFLQMNPGLRSRIQFQIKFPHYTADELYEIFLKFCREGGYGLAPAAAQELQNLLKALHRSQGETFANGRLVRSLFERAQLALAERVWSEPGTASLKLFLEEDIRSLKGYQDVAELLKAPPDRLWGDGCLRQAQTGCLAMQTDRRAAFLPLRRVYS